MSKQASVCALRDKFKCLVWNSYCALQITENFFFWAQKNLFMISRIFYPEQLGILQWGWELNNGTLCVLKISNLKMIFRRFGICFNFKRDLPCLDRPIAHWVSSNSHINTMKYWHVLTILLILLYKCNFEERPYWSIALFLLVMQGTRMSISLKNNHFKT